MTHNSPIFRKVLVLLAASGLLGAALFSATQAALGVGISPCTSVDLASSPYQVTRPPQPVTFTAYTTGCTTPEFQFYLQPPGGAWAAQAGYSTSTTFTWDTTGIAPGIWGIGVHARAFGRTAAYDVYYLGTYNIGIVYCTSVTLSPDNGPPQVPGKVITFTAATIDCASPEFRFLALPPGGTWTTVRAYAAGNTYIWNTTGLEPGTWTLGVWARQPGSKASYDSYAFTTYKLLPPAKCIAVSGSPNMTSPQAAGTSVQFYVVNSSGCGAAAQYEFWRLAPGGTWARVRTYNAALSWTWDTTGFANGRYEIMIRARAGTTAIYDTYVIFSFFIGA